MIPPESSVSAITERYAHFRICSYCYYMNMRLERIVSTQGMFFQTHIYMRCLFTCDPQQIRRPSRYSILNIYYRIRGIEIGAVLAADDEGTM